MIAEELAALVVPISSIQPHPANYRLGDVEGIATSLERFGQVRPILVQTSTGYIVAGNHTWKAAVQLGWESIAAVVRDMPDTEARAYMVADNRHSDVARNDDVALAAILNELYAQGELGGTGWSTDSVDDLNALMGQLRETEPEAFKGGYGDVEGGGDLPRPVNLDAVVLRQITLLYNPEEAERFAGAIDHLTRAWGTTGIALTVLRAVEECASAAGPV